MNITIDRASEDEADALVHVQIAAFHSDAQLYPGVPEDGPPGYTSVDDMLLKLRIGHAYTVRADGIIAGGMVIFDQGERKYHLGVIFVDPELHGNGIGSRALAFLDACYPDALLWTLDTPVYATRNHYFYEKHGYVRKGQFEVDGFALYAYEKYGPRSPATS
jgi:GNAT superfamily N-acetyltransferase